MTRHNLRITMTVKNRFPQAVMYICMYRNTTVFISSVLRTDRRSLANIRPPFYSVRFWGASCEARMTIISNDKNCRSLLDIPIRAWRMCGELWGANNLWSRSTSEFRGHVNSQLSYIMNKHKKSTWAGDSLMPLVSRLEKSRKPVYSDSSIHRMWINRLLPPVCALTSARKHNGMRAASVDDANDLGH